MGKVQYHPGSLRVLSGLPEGIGEDVCVLDGVGTVIEGAVGYEDLKVVVPPAEQQAFQHVAFSRKINCKNEWLARFTLLITVSSRGVGSN